MPLAALARALRDARGSERLAAVRDAYGRCARIAAKGEAEMAERFDRELLSEEAERALLRGAARGRRASWPTASPAATTPAR